MVVVKRATTMVLKLTETEKAIVQLLTQHGVIEDAKLEKHVQAIKADFRHEPPVNSLKEAFGRINKNLRPLSYEIKSVVKVRCGECKAMFNNKREQTCTACHAAKLDWVYYHGVANTEECDVSKSHGTDLSPEEIKFFIAMLRRLLRISATTVDMYGWKEHPSGWSHSQVDAVVEKLRINGWIHRDYNGFMEIGVRTYLECKPFLESLLRSEETPDDEDEESFRADIDAQVTGLPQVATY